MCLVLPRSAFFHVPKTGGTWVRSSIEKAGVPGYQALCRACTAKNAPKVRVCCFHATPEETDLPADGTTRLRFAFVRNPLSFYQSYWSDRMRRGWSDSRFDRAFVGVDFPAFVRELTRHCPGWATTVYEKYVGTEEHPLVDVIGRQERLADDLVSMLRAAGETVDEILLRDTPPNNISSQLQHLGDLCRHTHETEYLIRMSEKPAMVRFGYW